MKGQQTKAARNKRLQMRQKCRLIDNQIQVNLSKLEEMMKAIKSNKTQIRLYTIKQVDQKAVSEERSPQSQRTPRSEDKNSLRLKFKYSIQRQYEFDQTYNRRIVTLEREFQTNRIHQLQKEEMIKEQTQQYPSTSQFTPSPSRREEEELLLAEFSEHFQNKVEWGEMLKVRELTKKKIKCSQYTRINECYSIRVQTRYDWISNYLNEELNDTIVKGLTQEGEEVRIVGFNQCQDQFQCKIYHFQQQLHQKIIQKKQFQNTFHSNPTHKNSQFSLLKQQPINLTYQDFIHYNPEIQVQFHKHNLAVDIIQSQEQQVIKLDLTNSEKKVRVLVKSENLNANNMQRIMIFKKLPSTNHNDEKHQIVWSKYDKMSFVQDVILQGETNYLVANMCSNPSSAVSLIFNQEDIQNVKIQKSNYDPWKSYNILCSSFQQCSKVFMSQNVFDGTKPLEFLRSNFLDFGLVLEIYQNIYSENVAFLDNKQKNEGHKEDTQLLFSEIYTTQQNHNVYLPKQLVIKFFQVTQKPARLYFPQKRVLVGSKIAQNITIHSTFK